MDVLGNTLFCSIYCVVPVQTLVGKKKKNLSTGVRSGFFACTWLIEEPIMSGFGRTTLGVSQRCLGYYFCILLLHSCIRHSISLRLFCFMAVHNFLDSLDYQLCWGVSLQ